jgi:hypothetical protein
VRWWYLKKRTQPYINKYIHIFICTYTYEPTNVYTYMHTYIHTCIHTYIHTHVHTYTPGVVVDKERDAEVYEEEEGDEEFRGQAVLDEEARREDSDLEVVLPEEQDELVCVEQRVVALVVRVVALPRLVCGHVALAGERGRERVGDGRGQVRVSVAGKSGRTP